VTVFGIILTPPSNARTGRQRNPIIIAYKENTRTV
jgi:hypothetical protein